MGKPAIIVVGSANTDLTVLVDRLPAPGETVLGGDLMRACGGKGANQAVAAARAGAEVAFVGRVGDDEFGRAALGALRQEGIDISGVITDPDAPSGVALITVDASGENQITVAPGANARLCPADVHAAADRLGAADMLLLQLETPLDAVLAAIEVAHDNNVPVLLNPAPCPGAGLPGDLLTGVDYLVPNRAEAAHLSGMAPNEPPEKVARHLLAAGPRAVVVTLGADGCCGATADACQRMAAPVVRATDTVAAGDCFCGALAVALGEGRDVFDAMAFASAAAALAVQKAGAQPSLPARQDIERFLTRQGTAQRARQ